MGLPPVLLPEGRDPGLLRQHGAGVVGGVGALAGQEHVEGQGKLDDAAVLPIGPVGGDPHSDERRAREDDEEHGGDGNHPGAGRGPGTEEGQRGVEEGENGGAGSQEQGHGVAVESPGGAREEGAEPGRGGLEAGVVEETPREDPDGVEERQVARDEKEEPGDDRRVEGDAPGRGQVSLSSGGATGTGDPQEQTRLRTAHSILRRRPQAGQPM